MHGRRGARECARPEGSLLHSREALLKDSHSGGELGRRAGGAIQLRDTAEQRGGVRALSWGKGSGKGEGVCVKKKQTPLGTRLHFQRLLCPYTSLLCRLQRPGGALGDCSELGGTLLGGCAVPLPLLQLRRQRLGRKQV